LNCGIDPNPTVKATSETRSVGFPGRPHNRPACSKSWRRTGSRSAAGWCGVFFHPGGEAARTRRWLCGTLSRIAGEEAGSPVRQTSQLSCG
jgi:hypothetical protein